ncbi:kinase with adenine nucleotide alpha hydrolases-like domain-containing protein [Actinidia rufa]|uniref:non-specific serine/threonine protein kinase n=1 Tax=Actinidia rufa TaxID=165716 RepID=A0A7J0EKK5_9ERIC|nr:kinase with adenine nucleotide alpha hydrolases-like domain-containing protein [Actinidia rufa]
MNQRSFGSSAAAETVIVAVKAEKVISKMALAWALIHVVHPGDCVTLLAVLSGHKTGRRRSLWSFPRMTGDCGTVDRDKLPERISHQISESCSLMVLQLHYQIEVRVQIKVVSGIPTGAVAAEAKSHAASWVILDKMKHSTPVNSPEEPRRNKGKFSPRNTQNNLIDPLATLDVDREMIFTPSTRPKSSISNNHNGVFWIPQNHTVDKNTRASKNYRNTLKTKSSTTRNDFDTFVQFNRDMSRGPTLNQTHGRDYIFDSSIRQAVSLSRTSSIPPPLCSLCQHKAPIFGKPPRRFDYGELKEATDGFSDENFLAEGGFGTVHKGVLRDSQVVAVKQLKSAASKGDTDFFREVRVLSCAQHRNVVLLIGFCVEGKNRILVYEYICNGSLDFHLHGNKRTPLDWHSRQKIAIGAARGLRYLHEDCRVGCVVHRNMRPNNILLTHDYEPLVADFGLARLHTEWDMCDEQVVGTSGYLAPEYFSGGKIAKKIDIYTFGLVLLELISGQRTSDLQCYEGQHILAGKSFPLSAPHPGHILANKYQWLDPCLTSDQLCNLPPEVQGMGRAAFLCLQHDPESRPPMSKVLRVLEGGDGLIPLGLNSVGNRSGHMRGLRSNTQIESARMHSRTLSH